MQVGSIGEWKGWVVSPLVALAQLTPPKSTTAPRKRVSCVFHCASALRGGLGAPSTFKTALALRSSPSRIASEVFAFEGDRGRPAGDDKKLGEVDRALDRALGGPQSFEIGSRDTSSRRKIGKARRVGRQKTKKDATTQTEARRGWGWVWRCISEGVQLQRRGRSSQATVAVMGVMTHLWAASVRLDSKAKKKREAKTRRQTTKLKGKWEATGEAAWLRSRVIDLSWTLQEGKRRRGKEKEVYRKKQERAERVRHQQVWMNEAQFYREQYGSGGSLGADCPYDPVLAENVMGMMSDMEMHEPAMTKRAMKRSTVIEEREGGRFWWLP